MSYTITFLSTQQSSLKIYETSLMLWLGYSQHFQMFGFPLQDIASPDTQK
jgi:hypothetical protein